MKTVTNSSIDARVRGGTKPRARRLLALATCFLCAATVQAANTPITHIQSTGTTVPGATTCTVPIKPTLAGDILIIGATSSNGAIRSIKDNLGASYSAATTTTVSGSGFGIYYRVVPAGVTSLTLTYPYGTTTMIVSEYSGVASVSPVDKVVQHNNGYNSGLTYTSGLTAATTQDYELAWGFSSNIYSSMSSWTADSNWMPRFQAGSSLAQEHQMQSKGAIAATGTAAESSSDYDIESLLVTMKGVSAEPPINTVSPTVSMVAPATGTMQAGTITLKAVANDVVGIGNVTFFVDGASVGTALTAPFTLSWNSKTVADGPHAITAMATDLAGNTTTSAPVNITTNNTVPVISSFAASPYYIGKNSSTTLTWSIFSPTPDTISISGIGVVTGTSVGITPKVTTTYTITATNAAGTSTAQTTVYVNPGVNVILDSDIAVNVDDVGDHALLWALNKTGEANVIAMVTSSTNTWSAPTVAAIAKYYGHPGVMIGAYQGTSPSDYSTTNSYYTQQITSTFGTPGDTKANYPDAVTIYRKALAAVEDNTMVIVAGGFYEPLRSLLLSPADSISPLTGAQLVAKKVKLFVPASGWYPASGSASFNFAATPDAASYVFANWPGPIVAVGTDVGGDVLTGPSASADPAVNPIKDAYNLYCFNGQYCPNMQYSWTQAAILYAIRGDFAQAFSVEGSNGTMTVADSTQPVPGSDVWSQSPAGQVSYIRKIVSPATLAAQINALLQAAP